MSRNQKHAKKMPQPTNVLVGRHVEVVRNPEVHDITWPIRPIKGPEQGKAMAQYITEFFHTNKPSGKNAKVALICGPADRHVDTAGLILTHADVPWLTYKRTGAPFKVLSHAHEIDLGDHAARTEEELIRKFKIHDERTHYMKVFLKILAPYVLKDPDFLKQFAESISELQKSGRAKSIVENPKMAKKLVEKFIQNVDDFEFPHMLQERGKNFEIAKKAFGTYFSGRPGGDKPHDASLHQRVVMDQIDEIKKNYGVNDFVLITSGAAAKLFYLEATQNSGKLYKKKLRQLPESGIELYRNHPELPKQYDYYGHVYNPGKEIYLVDNFVKEPMHAFTESYPEFLEKFPELRQKFPGWKPD